jgi:DNA polymerase-1
LPDKILEYRQFTKLKTTYVDALPDLVNSESGRVHTSFNQTVAATGRLSSSNPNFQNIPIRTDFGRQIRKAFIPQYPDHVILSADYSQIELRIMAHLSDDPRLQEAFEKGEDIHASTAALVFDVPVEAVLPEQRRVAKIVNFGIMYGAGPYRMSTELGITVEEGKKLINNYFSKYPGINEYIIKTLEFARKHKYVSTLMGRKRYLADIDSANRNLRDASERVAINMPIQGTAADMIKIAMIRIQDRLSRELPDVMMILQIHDELVFELPQEQVSQARDIIVEEMEQALKLSVPIVVDVGVGESWYVTH